MATFGNFVLLLAGLSAITNVEARDVTISINKMFEKFGIHTWVDRDGWNILDGHIGVGLDHTCKQCDFSYKVSTVDEGRFRIEWETNNTKLQFKDCFSLQNDSLNWYGGSQIYTQPWPIEKLKLSGADPYVLRKADNFAVAERYWLNSNGTFFFISDDSPLFIDQNNERPGYICFIARVDGPYFNRTKLTLSYEIVVRDDAKQAHLYAVNNYLGKPSGMPNKKMISEPIWTTWAKYKQPIDQEKTLAFANDIRTHGFDKGQIELDEKWEDCFGTHNFDTKKFPNVSQMVKEIQKNFRMTLWIEPFVNTECTARCLEGEQNGYFVKNTSGSMSTIWWESNDARQIDFTNFAAAKWYSDSVNRLRTTYGFDGFKFDAGETNYAPQPSVYKNVGQYLIPNILSQIYVRTCAQFGDLIEVRSAFRTQDLPVFLRMIDKDSVWGLDDGLQSLITTLLQLNINGYTLVLPDMIGGNGYRAQPTAELIVRWTQATVFMPAMQFGFLPWDYKSDKFNATEIVKSMVDLHEKYSENITKAMNESIKTGTPVNPPIWWADPYDPIALATSDEFLLGENILVAPVMEEGAVSRDVYLPKGTWKDGNDGQIYNGPIKLHYHAPINILPYFIKQLFTIV